MDLRTPAEEVGQSRNENAAILSQSDWDMHKDVIINLYLHQKKELEEVRRILHARGLKATKRQYATRLKRWGVRKSIKSHTKDRLCVEIRDAFAAGGDIPEYTLRELKKLRRYWNTRLKQDSALSASDQLTLQALNHFILHCAFSPTPSNDDAEETTESSQSSASTCGNQGSSNSLLPQTATLSSFSNLQGNPCSPFHLLSGMNLCPRLSATYTPLDDSSIEIEDCMRLTKRFYSAKLEQHKSSHYTQQWTRTAISSSSVFEGHDQVYKTFWYNLESAIYYCKVGDTDLAEPLLLNIYHLVPSICELQPLALLRHVFTALAPSHTAAWQSLREFLLEIFTTSAHFQDGEQNPLWQIFYRLQKTSSVSSELFKSLLELLVADATKHLEANDSELFELRWSLVRLNRRSGNYGIAESTCNQLVLDAQEYFGRNDAQTRNAISELGYIQNDQGKYQNDQSKYRNALHIAEEVIRRTKADLQHNYPDSQCIYSMEDVAEVLQNIGGPRNLRSSALWLQRAYDTAQVLWGVSAADTVHIKKKLEALTY